MSGSRIVADRTALSQASSWAVPGSAFGAGLLFGAGLVISRMIDPEKVLGFLDIGAAPAGGWDPSLAFVMATAIPVAMLGIALGRRMRAPLLVPAFSTPAASKIDRRLVAGAVLFGAGWGLVGYCPGPALAALGNLSSGTLVFVAAMAAGMGAFRLLRT